jgi:heavy metal efflux system protein
MLDSIIRFSIHNKALVALMTIALMIWGGWSATQLPIDAVPDITDNQVQVITSAPSQSAPDIERLVTFPVEQTMATIPDIEEIRSFSRFGLSVVTLVFKEQVDVYWARQQVGERLVEAKSLIPDGVGVPALAPLTTGLGEIYQYVVHTLPGYEGRYDAMELRTIQDWIVRRQLLGVEGVADVSSFGGFLKQYEIALDPMQLRSMAVSIGDIFDALAQNNENTGGAYIDKQPYAWYIRSEGLIGNLDDIRNIPIKMGPTGIPILLRDVAKVDFGHAVRYGAMTRNDEGEVVGAIVMMLKGANSSKVIENVKERIAQISKTLPKGVVIEPYLDRTKLVDKAIATVTTNLTEGALIVVFVLVLLLGNVRGGLVVASVIPLAMLFAIALMHLFGVSGNLMSLGAIDFGLIVDGAVIIVEGTLHHLASRDGTAKLNQLEMDREVAHSAGKIMSSAAFGEIIILIVYLPILALVGVEGKMFKPMAQTVAFAILGAFLLSLTYVPMVSALFLSKKAARKRNVSDRLIGFIQKLYQPTLVYALRQRWAVLGAAVTLFAFGIWVFGQLGAEFIPTLDEGDFAVETRVLTGSSIEETIRVAQAAGKVLQDEFPEVVTVVGKVGSSEIPTDPMPVEACDLIIVLKDKSEWVSADTRDALAEQMHARLTELIPGVSYSFQQPIQMRFNELMSGARQDVVVKIYGENLDTLARVAAAIGQLAGRIEGAKDLYVEQATGLSQIVVAYRRPQIARFGLTIGDVNRAINTGFAGQSAGMVYEGERRFDMVVRLATDQRQSIEDVRNLPIMTADGQSVPLRQVADVNLQIGPNQIQRDDAKRRIIVGFNVRGRDVESIVEELQAMVDKEIDFPDGYYPTYGGTFENLIAARARLMIAVPAALVLIFLLLYFAFQSFGQSLLIFTAIPLSAIGGILALWIRSMPFSISAGVGFIALFGVAVLNGIVLIAEFNRLRRAGMDDVHAIILKGTATRLRPVIMTAAVASLGFLPMALSGSAGAEVQRPLATVVIGGLVSATLLTLLVLPCLYWVSQKGLRRPEKKAAAQGMGAGKALLLLLFALSLPFAPQAQGLTLAAAEARAVAYHQEMQLAGMAVQYQEALAKTQGELPKLDAQVMVGQYNSAEWRDNNFSLSQSMPFPTVFAHRKGLAQAQVQEAVLQQAVTRNEVVYQLRDTWSRLHYLYAHGAALRSQDSIFAALERAARLRYETGEANLLEKANAVTERSKVQNQLSLNNIDIKMALHKLQWMIHLDVLPDFGDTTWATLPPPSVDLTAPSAEGNPYLATLDQAAVIAQQEKALLHSKMLPGISLGYFNQTLIGYQTRNGNEVFFGPNTRFQGITLGLSIPLWIKPELAKLDAAQVQIANAKRARTLGDQNLQHLIVQEMMTLDREATSLAWYATAALPNAALILQQSTKAFAQGEIAYTSHMLHLQQAIALQTDHLQAMLRYNQSVLRLHYLLGTFSNSNSN